MAVLNEAPSMGAVRLGNKHLPVVPQKHAKLRRYLSYGDFQAILSKDYSEKAYHLLCILIPAMDPKINKNVVEGNAIEEWEFDGFPTEELWQRYKSGDLDAYDEDVDPGPTTDEIAIAFETALKVNGAGRLGKIVTLVQAATRVVEMEEQGQDFSSMLPGSSGESPSTTSGTNPPTSTQNGG
jgi:hypothetical protein